MFNKDYFDRIHNNGTRDLKLVSIVVKNGTTISGELLEVCNTSIRVRQTSQQILDIPYDQINSVQVI